MCKPPSFNQVTVSPTLIVKLPKIHAKNDDPYILNYIPDCKRKIVLIGAPFGMVQLSPDTRIEGWDGCGGYHFSDSIIYGFSHTHLSGTGISDYADVLLMPTTGKIQLTNGIDEAKINKAPINNLGYASKFSHKNEIAQAGYYLSLIHI